MILQPSNPRVNWTRAAYCQCFTPNPALQKKSQSQGGRGRRSRRKAWWADSRWLTNAGICLLYTWLDKIDPNKNQISRLWLRHDEVFPKNKGLLLLLCRVRFEGRKRDPLFNTGLKGQISVWLGSSSRRKNPEDVGFTGKAWPCRIDRQSVQVLVQKYEAIPGKHMMWEGMKTKHTPHRKQITGINLLVIYWVVSCDTVSHCWKFQVLWFFDGDMRYDAVPFSQRDVIESTSGSKTSTLWSEERMWLQLATQSIVASYEI